ncbi:hypothetical protein BC629DRAFT_1441903 [Irpex lacteus]|nr:hypothetical protein BC629DRAFT_1441903 [Irpex lacteus]
MKNTLYDSFKPSTSLNNKLNLMIILDFKTTTHTRNEGDKEPSLSDMEVWLDDSESEVERILYPVGDDHNRNSIMQCTGGKYDVIAESAESATGNVHPRSLTPQNRGNTTPVSTHQNGKKYGVKNITPLRRQIGFDKSGTELKRRLHSPANNNEATMSCAYFIGVDTTRKSKRLRKSDTYGP